MWPIVSRMTAKSGASRREIHRRNIFAVHLFFSLRRGSGESRRMDLGSISVGPRPGSDRPSGRRGGGGRTGRIYVFGEGQGNEGSDKCSERAEDSWMQQAGKTGRKGGNARGGTDALARRASQARYRDEFHSPDRFRRRGRDAEGRFRDPGNPRHPESEKGHDRRNPESVNPY